MNLKYVLEALGLREAENIVQTAAACFGSVRRQVDRSMLRRMPGMEIPPTYVPWTRLSNPSRKCQVMQAPDISSYWILANGLRGTRPLSLTLFLRNLAMSYSRS